MGALQATAEPPALSPLRISGTEAWRRLAVPCWNCRHVYAGAICNICKKPRKREDMVEADPIRQTREVALAGAMAVVAMFRKSRASVPDIVGTIHGRHIEALLKLELRAFYGPPSNRPDDLAEIRALVAVDKVLTASLFRLFGLGAPITHDADLFLDQLGQYCMLVCQEAVGMVVGKPKTETEGGPSRGH